MGAAPAGREWSQRQKRREKFPAVFISWLPSPQPQLPGAAEFTLNKERRLKKKKKSCVYKTRNASAKSFQRERLKWRTDAFLIRYDANLTFTLSWCPRPPRLLQTRQAESAQRLTLVCLLRASFSLFLPFPFVPFSCISFLMFYFLVIPATPFCLYLPYSRSHTFSQLSFTSLSASVIISSPLPPTAFGFLNPPK